MVNHSVRTIWVTLRPAVLPALVVTVLGFVASSAGGSTEQAGINGAIFVTIVVALYMFSGNSGVISIAHAAFVEVGAYVSALLTLPTGLKAQIVPGLPSWLRSTTLPFSLSVPVAMLATGVVAAISGLFLMRLRGLQSAVATFSLLLGISSLAGNWRSVTAGPSPLYGIPVHTTMAVAVGLAIATILVAAVFQRTHLCLRLRASREDHVAAVGSGVNLISDRRVSFIVSAMLCGLGGALYSANLGTISPDGFGLGMTFLILAMLIIGGLRSLAGAVLGTVVVTVLTQILLVVENGTEIFGIHIKGPTGLSEVGLGVAFLLILLLRPSGLTGGQEVVFPNVKRIRDGSHPDEKDEEHRTTRLGARGVFAGRRRV